MTRRFFENDTSTSPKGVDSSMTSGTSVETGWSHIPDTADVSTSLPTTMTSHQSSSLPSTPYQRPRTFSYQTRPPSPGRVGGHASPRSSHSDSNQSLPALRKTAGACKYETGMAQARRRVPYSMGPDKLGPERSPLKESLTDIEDEKLSGDMRELYDRLQPSPESEVRRKKLVEKLDKILNERWPGHSIKVNVFGSTGNKLGTTDSDVDICITTDLKDLERVCRLAELLASHGMERVVCVSSAKVPIVKIWDPELRLACDMNVNNPIALENTEMIHTYVGIDLRVRPLAMIIKYWAKRRILNEPGMCDSTLPNDDLDVNSLEALGSTLSSYTWICMIINFLQTRRPPILPSLQQKPNLKRKVMNGIDVTFDKDASLYSGYGSRNKDSLGQLLFQFFRYYGHELDFEKKVISVRLGKVISKVEKGWSFLQDNRLCVEEPFNISRNLGNTADDTSMRGIHLELRRAFEMVAEGNLEKCCEQYEYPVDEGKMSEIFVLPEPRPIVAQMPPPQPASRGRGNGRGKHTSSRGGSNANRRASNSGTRVHPSLHHFGYQMTPQELQLHAQQQQFLLHDQLFQQYQYLQAQEQELRLQLQQQAFLPGRATTSMAYPHIPFPSYAASDSGHEEANGGRVDALSNTPLTAPVLQYRFPYASPYLPMAIPRMQSPVTNPSSPRLRSAVPERQRVSRHASLTDPFPASALRAQSQPARSIPSPLAFQPVMTEGTEESDSTGNSLPQSRRQSTASNSRDLLPGYLTSHKPSLPRHLGYQGRSSEYIGYYVGHSPPLQTRSRSSIASPVPSYTGLAIQNGGLSPRLFAQIPSYQPAVISPPPERVQSPSDESVMGENGSVGSFQRSAARQTPPQLKAKRSGPLVVNGSTAYQDKQVDANGDGPEPSTGTNFSASTSEDLAFDTPTSSEDQSQGLPEAIDSELPPLFAHSHPEPIEESLHGAMNSIHARYSLTDGRVDRGSGTVQMSARSSTAAAKMQGDQSPLSNDVGGQPVQGQIPTQLSPVREVPISLPNGHSHAYESPQDANTCAAKPKAKGKQEKLPLPGVEYQRRKDETSTATINGTIPSLNEKNIPNGMAKNNGWQTPKKKKHRKASKSESDISLSNVVGGDFLPIQENLRKGG